MPDLLWDPAPWHPPAPAGGGKRLLAPGTKCRVGASAVPGGRVVYSPDKSGCRRGSTDHLLTADFFDQPNFPSITFKSTKVEFMDKNRARITGDLNLKNSRGDYGMFWGSEEIERGWRAFDE